MKFDNMHQQQRKEYKQEQINIEQPPNPSKMATLNPYLNFNGNCEEALNFYKSVFGGEFATIMRFKDVPSEHPIPEGENEKITHIALPIGKTAILMASDVPSSMEPVSIGNNVTISINTDSEEEAKKIFEGLSSDGKIMMKLEKAFWGDLFGMFTDKFGINWMVSYHYPEES